MPHASGIGAIFGIVSELGVAKGGGRVGLYDRTTQQLIQKTTADSLGGYVFTGLNQNTNDYLLMALDDDGTPPKNALAQDYIQPIPGHMGATAICNWHLLSMRMNPLWCWYPRFVGTFPIVSGPSYGNVATNGTLIEGTNSITPGAPQIPTVTLNGGAVYIPLRSSGAGNGVQAPQGLLSFEWVLDTSVSGGIFFYRRAWYYISGQHYIAGMCWNRSNKTLTWAHGTDATGYGPNSSDFSFNHALWNPTNYAASALSDAPHHFVLTLKMGEQAKLYIDSVLVQTTSMIGRPSTFDSRSFYTSGAIAGAQTSLGFQKNSLVAGYPVAMTQAQVTNNYNALIIGSSPLVSGYVRDVLTDEPGVFIRCNEAAGLEILDFLSGWGQHLYGSAVLQIPSPVLGGAMIYFNGGVCWNYGLGAPLSRTQNTIEFWYKPDSATPPALRTIAAGRWSDDTNYNWYINQLQTTGKLTVGLRVSTGSMDTVNFNYAPSAATEVLVCMIFDKLNGTARVYENGVLKDTQSMTVGYFYWTDYDTSNAVNTTEWAKCVFHLGGLRTGAGAVSQPAMARISEFAIYPHLLTADRILSHYDSRTLI